MAHAPSANEPHALPASTRRYYVVWIALLVLTAITVIVGRVHLGHGLGLVVALVIATVKASLVALFFMHLWEHGGANRLVLVTSVFFFFLLLGIVLLDNASRFPLTNPPTQETLRWQPPGPDILSPAVSGQGQAQRRDAPGARGGGTSTQHAGERDQAPQQQR